ncbi:DUF928 domain-containing protein [Prochlorothrix hollandica]|uniref:DUF928 domain-containing protein n=1 Tax=Prochlorothrix hollandica TaxID=1223 RepID=UPI00034C0953|nr:DUF928 domain-containing protein [Prochlorothrix hollandica]
MGSTPTLQAWGWISASLIPSSLISASLISATFTVCTLSPAQALSFKPPAESVPANSLGGGVRGKVQFTAPSSAAPVNSLGGGVRGRVQFAVPAQATPSDSLGGGTRGGVRFTVPAQATPSDSLGGGTRGGVRFTVPAQAAPRASVSGGSRAADRVADSLAVTPNSATTIAALDPHFETLSRPLEPIALVPDRQYLSYTVSPRPTFFVYMPPMATDGVFFSIQAENGEPLYHTLLQVPADGGIVRFTLPDDAPALALNENYAWFFVPIEAGGTLRPDSPGTVAWIKRVESPLTASDLASSVPTLEQVTQLAQAGIWYDTLAALDQGLQGEPGTSEPLESDLWASEWDDLLQSVGLEAVLYQP